MIVVLLAVLALYFGVNICIGKYQAYRFDTEQERINHKLWASIYGIACFQSFWFFHNWLLIASCVAMHLPVFNTALNYFRKPRRSMWYTNPADLKGSKLDRLWATHYPLVFYIFSLSTVILCLLTILLG